MPGLYQRVINSQQPQQKYCGKMLFAFSAAQNKFMPTTKEKNMVLNVMPVQLRNWEFCQQQWQLNTEVKAREWQVWVCVCVSVCVCVRERRCCCAVRLLSEHS